VSLVKEDTIKFWKSAMSGSWSKSFWRIFWHWNCI